MERVVITKQGLKKKSVNPSPVGLALSKVEYFPITCKECDCEFLYPKVNMVRSPYATHDDLEIECPNRSCTGHGLILLYPDGQYENHRYGKTCCSVL